MVAASIPAGAVQVVARVGYAARGVVFLILGIFAVLAAIGAHTHAVGGTGVFRALLRAPLGGLLVLLVAAGLFCFALWRAMEAILDVQGCGSDWKGLMRRLGFGVAALFYAGFASVALSTLLERRSENSDRSVQDWTAWALDSHFGSWFVLLIGAGIIATGLGFAIVGLRAGFRKQIALTKEPRLLVTILGVAGFVARSFIFVMIGLLLIFAAVHANAHEAKGVAGTLEVIQQQPYGSALLSITAIGLIAFGMFCLAEAKYRRLPKKPLPKLVRS